MHAGTTDWLKMMTVIGTVAAAVWWLESRFDSLVAVIVIGGLFGVIFFAGGAFLSHMIQKSTLQNVTNFAQRDAKTDRYRMQSFKALASGQAAMERAAAQLTVLDAKRVDKMAEQRSKLLTDAHQARWEIEQQAENADAWTWDDDDAGDTFETWE